ncbi:hypothetical protein NPIL_239341 [Nephila pilipes]|uniref:Insertion element IS150 protein InsJ-like helix-turn-helix domain-containing protein n=1 Tax=Nephila pilipes TaxID=299642 RepID=A0A8X6QHF4_NEPPI|nr:hypothetical protein NPIL_239341 [Nephila pilipes]
MTSKSKELDISVKNTIIRLRNEGLTYRAIGVQLNISSFTVRSVVKKFKETGSTKNKTKSGRPRIFSTREKRVIINKVKKNPKISAPQIARDVAFTSQKTLSYRLYGMFYKRKVIMEG